MWFKENFLSSHKLIGSKIPILCDEWNWSGQNIIQLTLEPHGFELRGSTQTWISFPINTCTVFFDHLGVADAEDQHHFIQGSWAFMAFGFWEASWNQSPMMPRDNYISGESEAVQDFLLQGGLVGAARCPHQMKPTQPLFKHSLPLYIWKDTDWGSLQSSKRTFCTSFHDPSLRFSCKRLI